MRLFNENQSSSKFFILMLTIVQKSPRFYLSCLRSESLVSNSLIFHHYPGATYHYDYQDEHIIDNYRALIFNAETLR